ncbi:MAG: efflux RND transporter periplasmic adaptor subunit [Gammaproteobacteria bacterium]|nr:efflux RND transporter periplasmic adaptor subunit [Gammaproteobacteria bacterium]
MSSEANLLSITLTPEAHQRLGVATIKVAMRTTSATRLATGEVVNAPFGASGVPSVSTSDFAALAGRQAAADAELHRAWAALKLAQQMAQRADALLIEEAGSIRSRDEAVAQRAAAEAALAAARAQRELLGPDLAAIHGKAALWVRVPVFATDMPRVAADQEASIGVPGSDAPTRKVAPVRTPPTANPAAGTIDLYYRFDNHDQVYRLGQRVAVAVPLKGPAQGLAIPASALVTDIHGGEWVYRQTVDGQYQRQRVEVVRPDGEDLILARGLAAGDEIVSAGAAELFGYEFGTGR